MKRRIHALVLAASFPLLSLLGLTVLVSSTVAADTVSEIRQGSDDIGGDDTGNEADRVPGIIRIVINIIIFLVGAVAVMMLVISGFRFVASNGDSNAVGEARKGAMYAVIGIVVAFLAYALVDFIVGQLNAAS